ncbi:MAG: GNAT family N-acetyltransferase [Candidatus Aminicenantes bacterium]|nr:MAG: GNAT family N-acetyltransferase [Candidatus Aminicenantes bacterium]
MRVERVTSYERFVETKKDWNKLLSRSGQNCPFLTHQWFDAWWQNFGPNDELGILFFWDDSASLGGISPLMVSGAALRFMASHEVTDYCDFISCEDYRVKFYEHLLDHFQMNSSKYYPMELINIPESSPTLSILPGLAAGRGWEYESHENEIAPVLKLSESYEEFLQNLGRKNRHELRRKTRKWESLGNVRIEKVTEPEKLSLAIKKFVSLHKESSPAKQEFWQKKGMPEFFSQLVHHFAIENWAELHMLYVEDRLIAALLCFPYEDIVYFYNIAYDRGYSPLSPGFFLFDQAIKQSIAQGKKVADFLRGREKYKYFFGAKESKIYSLKLKHKEDNP